MQGSVYIDPASPTSMICQNLIIVYIGMIALNTASSTTAPTTPPTNPPIAPDIVLLGLILGASLGP